MLNTRLIHIDPDTENNKLLKVLPLSYEPQEDKNQTISDIFKKYGIPNSPSVGATKTEQILCLIGDLETHEIKYKIGRAV